MKNQNLRKRFSKPNILFKSIGILIILTIFNHFVPMGFVMNLLIYIGADVIAIIAND